MPELDRRDFLKLVGAGAGAAATAGCSEPVDKLIPYVVQPAEIIPGIPVHYASTCTECSAGCGTVVKTREGRPIKVEGNPRDPVSAGNLCGRGQAAIARTYHPDRYKGPRRREGDGLVDASWDEAVSTLADRIGALRQKGEISKLRVLGGSRGPTLDALIDRWLRAAGADPDAQRLVHQPLGWGALRAASEAVFGAAREPVFDLSGADLVVDFGSDFLDAGPSPTAHARQLAEARAVESFDDGGARLWAVGPRMNLTVSNADRWLPAAAGSEGSVALAVAKLVHDRLRRAGRSVAGDAGAIRRALSGADPAATAERAGLALADLEELADRLVAAEAPVALPPGVSARTPRAVADSAAVLMIDAMLGAVGRTVRIPREDVGRAPATDAQIAALVEDMRAGGVEVLLIHDANPLYSLPADSGFAEALGEVGLVVSFASMADETAERADWVLPDHAPFESWGDSSSRPGVRTLVQPSIRPLHDTQALGDTLLTLGRALGDDVGSRLPSGSFRQVLQQAWSDTDWRAALAAGGVFDEDTSSLPGRIAAGVGELEFAAAELEGGGDFVLVPYARQLFGDGSGASLPWAQETPDPVTKAAWTSWAEVSLETARRLGVSFGDVIRVETGFGPGHVELPVFPRGGVRDDVVAVGIGQGHSVGYYASRGGQPRGANVLSILPDRRDEGGSRAFVATRARLAATGGYERIAITQWTDNQHERGVAPQVALAELHGGNGHGEHGKHGGEDGHGAAGNVARGHFVHGDLGLESPYDPAVDADPESPYRWGMVIDNDRCNGCSACVVACSVENNVPVVGEDNVIRHREMTWIRIERYVGDGKREGGRERRSWPGPLEELGKTDIRHFPMLCQHCGAAPCESVCPVIATYHNPEGLNGMIYNRCVGTRYCANNCTYKVRRFNYFDYALESWPGLLRLQLNPDVTVREQGVMEKCQFCVQRIEAARQPAKDEGRPIRDGEVVPACQQTCPTGAITFGNTRDPEARVVKQADGAPKRAYHSLMSLNTRPGITYLAQVGREVDEHSDGEHHG